MAQTLTIVSERVDDLPVLLAQLDRMGVPPLLDAHFPTHGNWVGLSLGWVSVLWLTHLLSEGDHRLNHVALWAKQRLQTLRACTGQPVPPLDVGDDRLATVLEALSDDTRWSACEGALNQHTLRVYDLAAGLRSPGSYDRQRPLDRDGRRAVAVWAQPRPSPRPAPGQDHGVGPGAPGDAGGDGHRARAAGR
jgi:hypothetical protein